MATTLAQKAPAERPMFRPSSFRSRSFIQDHQQYRAPHNSGGIDHVLEDHQLVSTTNAVAYLSLMPVAGAGTNNKPQVKHSGVVHTMTHPQCQPGPDDAERLIATIFYKSQDTRHPHAHSDTTNIPGSSELLEQPSLSAGAAPVADLERYPLEPPESEPESLDHLYGHYISQMCLAHFLQIIDDLQNPWQRITSSHRCLDSQSHPRVMDVTFSPPPNPDYISLDDLRRHESVWRFEQEWNVDVTIQRDDVWRRHKRLVVFDMDSTLIQQEVIDEIAREVGVEAEVSAITSRAMNGELDFTASLRHRVALLKGAPADIFEKVKSAITITPGARELCRALKRLGYKTAVLSGGFAPLAQWLAGELGLDYAFANHLAVSEDGASLTGELSGEIVNAECKAALLEKIAMKEGALPKQVIAVGDGANDLPMLKKAGLGIAFNAKPVVQLEAPSRINSRSLLDILFILGFTQEEQDDLLN